MSTTDSWEQRQLDRERADREERRRRAEGPFQELCSGFMHLAGWATGRTAKRLDRALSALREYRRANQQDEDMGSYPLMLGVRVVADELARQIQETAGPDQDPATIAWVLAGMRCPARPFCTGCSSCFTVTDPPGCRPRRAAVEGAHRVHHRPGPGPPVPRRRRRAPLLDH